MLQLILLFQSMRSHCFIVLVFFVTQGCQSSKCTCPITSCQQNEINSALRKLDEVLSYEWREKFSGFKERRLNVEISSVFSRYKKTYELIPHSDQSYLRIELIEKFTDNKVIRLQSLHAELYTLSTEQVGDIYNAIDKSCLLTRPVNIIADSSSTDIFTYVVESYLPEGCACTNNQYHMVRRSSQTNQDIANVLQVLFLIEPASDIESMITQELR